MYARYMNVNIPPHPTQPPYSKSSTSTRAVFHPLAKTCWHQPLMVKKCKNCGKMLVNCLVTFALSLLYVRPSGDDFPNPNHSGDITARWWCFIQTKMKTWFQMAILIGKMTIIPHYFQTKPYIIIYRCIGKSDNMGFKYILGNNDDVWFLKSWGKIMLNLE